MRSLLGFTFKDLRPHLIKRSYNPILYNCGRKFIVYFVYIQNAPARDVLGANLPFSGNVIRYRDWRLMGIVTAKQATDSCAGQQEFDYSKALRH